MSAKRCGNCVFKDEKPVGHSCLDCAFSAVEYGSETFTGWVPIGVAYLSEEAA